MNDHAATYRTDEGERIVLWEPYQVYPEDLAEVASSAHAEGIDLYLSGQSPYNPGQTLGIYFSRGEPR